MAERHTIETYGRAAHNRNIWSTAAERHTIDYVTPGRFFCLCFLPPLYHYLWVLEAAGEEQDLLNLFKKRKLSNFGHMMRKEGDCLEKEIVHGTVPWARKQGRPKMRWIDDVEKCAKMSFEKLLRETEDRWSWRRLIVHEATNPRNEDG